MHQNEDNQDFTRIEFGKGSPRHGFFKGGELVWLTYNLK